MNAQVAATRLDLKLARPLARKFYEQVVSGSVEEYVPRAGCRSCGKLAPLRVTPPSPGTRLCESPGSVFRGVTPGDSQSLVPGLGGVGGCNRRRI